MIATTETDTAVTASSRDYNSSDSHSNELAVTATAVQLHTAKASLTLIYNDTNTRSRIPIILNRSTILLKKL